MSECIHIGDCCFSTAGARSHRELSALFGERLMTLLTEGMRRLSVDSGLQVYQSNPASSMATPERSKPMFREKSTDSSCGHQARRSYRKSPPRLDVSHTTPLRAIRSSLLAGRCSIAIPPRRASSSQLTPFTACQNQVHKRAFRCDRVHNALRPAVQRTWSPEPVLSGHRAARCPQLGIV